MGLYTAERDARENEIVRGCRDAPEDSPQSRRERGEDRQEGLSVPSVTSASSDGPRVATPSSVMLNRIIAHANDAARAYLPQRMPNATHLNLDDAWPAGVLDLPTRDVRAWGPRLRYIARRPDVEAFYREIASDLGDLVLYGSGDFHHLAGALIRRVRATGVTLVSFDNHPDWDVRPPYWSCGGWAARTLRTGRVERVSVWGCGNFELQRPARWFADRAALRAGTFEVHAWAERQPASVRRRFDCMTRANWRERFHAFASGLSGRPVYVTVDLDGLRREEAVTNWENGLFTADDVAWAIATVGDKASVVGGDVCGAYSPPSYERAVQRVAGRWDHPKLPPIDRGEAHRLNVASLAIIWNALAGACVDLPRRSSET